MMHGTHRQPEQEAPMEEKEAAILISLLMYYNSGTYFLKECEESGSS